MHHTEQESRQLEDENAQLRKRLAELEKNNTERPSKFYKALINKAPDGVVLLGENFRISYVSPAAERLFGYSVKELKKMSPDDLTHPDDLADVHKVLQHILNPETENFGTASYRFQRKDGEWRWIESTFTNLMQDPGIRGMVINFRDITDRVEAKIALKESEERFRSIFENATIGLYRSTPDGRILMANPTLLDMLGYASFEELAQRDLNKDGFDPQYERSTFIDRIERDGKIVGLEAAWISQSGEQKFVRESAKAIKDTNGKTLYYEGTIENITERIRAEENLKERNENFHSFFHSIDNFLFILDTEARILDVNQAVLDRLGYSLNELQGESVLFVHPKPHWDEAQQIIGEMLQGERDFCPVPLLTKDGVEIPVETQVSFGTWNGLPAIFGVSKDISALKQSEEKFRLIYENMSVGVARVSMDFTIEAANAAYCQMLGYREDELIGKHLQEITHPMEVEENLEKQTELGLGKIDHYRMEKRFIHKDGYIVHGILDANLIRDIDGSPAYFLGSVVDITERKQAEENLQASESKYRALFDGISDAAFVHILQDEGFSSFLEVNEIACQRLGYSREELLSLSPADISAPEDVWRRGSREVRARLRKERWQIFEATHIAKNGERLPVEISSRAFQMGEETVMVSLARDIRERKKAQEEIQKLSKMVETTSQSVVIADTEGKVVYVNAAILSTLGYERKEEIVGKTIFEFTDEPGKHKLEKEILPTLQTVGYWRGEINSKCKDGTLLPCEEFCNILLNEQGEIEYYVASFIDITEKIQSRNKIQNYIERLDALRKIDQAIINSFDLRVTLSIIIDYLISELQVDAAAILKHDESTHALIFVKGQGFRTKTLQDARLRVGRGYAGKVALERQSFYIPNLATVDFGISNSPDFKDLRFN